MAIVAMLMVDCEQVMVLCTEVPNEGIPKIGVVFRKVSVYGLYSVGLVVVY